MNAGGTTRTRTVVTLAVLLLAAAGLGRDLSVHAWKEKLWRGVPVYRVDTRYARLRALTGRAGRFGFVTDAQGELAMRRYFDASYALAPALVTFGPQARTIVDAATSAEAARLARELGARDATVFDDGTGLAQ